MVWLETLPGSGGLTPVRCFVFSEERIESRARQAGHLARLAVIPAHKSDQVLQIPPLSFRNGRFPNLFQSGRRFENARADLRLGLADRLLRERVPRHLDANIWQKVLGGKHGFVLCRNQSFFQGPNQFPDIAGPRIFGHHIPKFSRESLGFKSQASA